MIYICTMKNMVSSTAAVRAPWSDWAFDNKLRCTFPIHCNSIGLILIDSISWHIAKLFLNLINSMIFEDSGLLRRVVVSRFMVNGVWKAFNSAIFRRKMTELHHKSLTQWHDITSQKNSVLRNTVLRTSNLAYIICSECTVLNEIITF